MKLRIFAVTIAAVSLAAGGRFLMGQGTRARATQTPALSPMSLKSALPSAATAKTLLQATPRHREWVGVPVGSGIVLAFVVYPERSDKAPVVVVTAKNQGASVWVRAISDQVAAEGFIAVAPEVLTGLGPKGGDSESFRTQDEVIHALGRMGSEEIARRINAVREYAVSLPSANGKSASLELDGGDAKINVVMHSSGAETRAPGFGLTFGLTEGGWREALAYLNEKSDNRPVFGASLLAPENEHAEHMGMMMQAARGERASSGGSQGVAESLAVKRRDLPANYYTARSILAHSKLRKEWVDIPVGDVKLHTWVEYPQGNGKAGVVVVMQYGTGMDEWFEAVADQLAQEGFIAIAPDTWSGTGVNGGGRDTFQFVDDAMKAGARITPDETQRRFKAARDYAMKLCRGGVLRHAAERRGHGQDQGAGFGLLRRERCASDRHGRTGHRGDEETGEILRASHLPKDYPLLRVLSGRRFEHGGGGRCLAPDDRVSEAELELKITHALPRTFDHPWAGDHISLPAKFINVRQIRP